MTLRPAICEDLPNIRALHIRNWRADYAGSVPADRLGPPLEDEMAARWQALPALHLVVAERAGRFAGFALTDLDDPDGPCLHSLHLLPAARGGGLGKALFVDAQAAARGRAKPLWLVVLAANHTARAIYRHWGGVEGREFAYDILGTSLPSVRVVFPNADA